MMTRITIGLIAAVSLGAARLQAQTPAPASAPAAPATPRITRVDIQTLTASVRYRAIENSKGVLTNNQLQDREVFKGRVKFDRGGNYSVNIGAGTGASISSGWNNTGIGTGDTVVSMFVKHLYFAAVPVKGLELQYGSLAPLRGEATEVTTLDDDAYVTGKRVSISRPTEWFFDEIALTQAYLGDLTTPNVFSRFHSLESSNYYQGLVRKKVSRRLSASAYYVRADGVPAVHGAVTVTFPLRIADTLRYEQYFRGGASADEGFAVVGEKKLGKKATVGAGWVSIDPKFGGLNGDRYFHGRRLVLNSSFALSSELTAAAFFTRAVVDPAPMANKTRFDVILTYNALKTLQRAGWF